MEPWVVELQGGKSDAAWDLFLDRYRRLVFAAIRYYAQDYDDIMDVFARVCESLRENDLERLRCYVDQPGHTAKFSTWLVTVVRHLTVDWFRHRDGRRRVSSIASTLPPLRQRIFEHVFLHKRSHGETYELICSTGEASLSFGEFLKELRATYNAVADGRRGSILRELLGPPPPEQVLVVSDESADDRRESLEFALRSLSPDERVAVELYVVDEMSAEAVAKVVGWSNAKAVYNHVYRALSAMRSYLSSLDGAGRPTGKI
ncbi:MAG TPA: sigma-70 family RNA polymerase sigma factor [Gemmatimonadales bacterium]|nr:sigma-70 family RNA polymerase sigma factor [Gemmatimonadales bacterium]